MVVILDFGNVVAFFDHRRACRQLAALSARGVTEDEVHAAIFRGPIEPDLDSDRLSSAAFIAALRARFDLAGSDQAIADAWCDIFTPNADMEQQIAALDRAGHRLVLASNTNALHFNWIARQFAAVLGHFDALVLSHEVGARKPDRRFFERCIAEAGVVPAQCLYVDDRADFVKTARSLGMSGLVYTPGQTVLAL